MPPKGLKEHRLKKARAKARERAAKAVGAVRDTEDTERAKKVERAGIGPAAWDVVLRVLERRLGPKWDVTLGKSSHARGARRKP